MAQVTLNPGPGGRTTAMITLASGTGTPLASKEVVVALSNPALGIESVERHATQVGTGVWRADDLILPVPGRWRIRVDALVDDFDKVTLESEIDVR
jgi:copper transport protein